MTEEQQIKAKGTKRKKNKNKDKKLENKNERKNQQNQKINKADKPLAILATEKKIMQVTAKRKREVIIDAIFTTF